MQNDRTGHSAFCILTSAIGPGHGRPVIRRYFNVSLLAARPGIVSTDSLISHARTSAGVRTIGLVVLLLPPPLRGELPNLPLPGGFVVIVVLVLARTSAHMPAVFGQAMLVPDSTA